MASHDEQMRSLPNSHRKRSMGKHEMEGTHERFGIALSEGSFVELDYFPEIRYTAVIFNVYIL